MFRNGFLTAWHHRLGRRLAARPIRRILDKLFQPFSRGEVLRNQQGLGLGLNISAGIAKAHGGTLSVQSGEDETKFIFRMDTGQTPTVFYGIAGRILIEF